MGYGNTEIYLTPEAREKLIQTYLGKTVTVEIDRPIGFHHVTKGIHLDYTVNYGYLPGVSGGDGEEQDVYVLGVSEPIEQFTGRIIGAVRRADDNEDKLVAAPEGMTFTKEQIAEEIRFVEQYFDSTIESIFD
ncbi:MAG: inorganic diphosphatase [Oscillospiraceae bacterium]|nr:inorganic diphosphatase [Oscillospiraceae bacterium]